MDIYIFIREMRGQWEGCLGFCELQLIYLWVAHDQTCKQYRLGYAG